MFLTIIFASALLLVSTAAAQDSDRHHTAPRNATIDAAGARRLFVEAQAGTLRIEGRSGINEVRVTGTARASVENDLEEIQLRTSRDGDAVRVIVDIPDRASGGWGNRYRGLDLVLEVPNTLVAEVEDGSGELEIRGIAGLDLEDGSGGIEIADIGGAVRVVDGSGGISIRNVRGDVRITDGSGAIEIREVTGTLTIEEDGSGEIIAESIGASVLVREDGSGSIRVTDVGGDFTVERDGSGSISYRDVEGKVDVPRKR